MRLTCGRCTDKEVSLEAAAVEVRHEVEDLRETLGKLRHTVNTTTDGVKDASNDLEKKVSSLAGRTMGSGRRLDQIPGR